MIKAQYRFLIQSFAFALVCLMIFSSCAKNTSDTTGGTPAASVMAFNLAPDKTSVGFALSKSVFTSALAYAKYTGVYVAVPPGSKTLEASDYGSTASPFASTSVDFKEDNFYSVFLVGKGAHYKTMVADDNIASLSGTSGLAYVRYVNAIVDSVSSATVIVTDNANKVAINDGAVFPYVSTFKGIDPGTINITVTNNTGLNLNKTFVTEPKKVYTILLSGLQNSTSTPAVINVITNGALD